MIKRLFWAVAVVLQVLSAGAQNEVGTWGFRPHIGLNISQMAGDGSDGLKSKVGFVGGVDVDYQATSMLGLSAALMFSSQGARMEPEVLPIDKVELSYINLPVMPVSMFTRGLL